MVLLIFSLLIELNGVFATSVRSVENQVKSGAVASEDKACSQIGIDLMKAGGNAADAAIGTMLCVGTKAMYHSGIGGGGIALVRSTNGSYEMIDFRETAPKAASQNMFDGNYKGSLVGGLASAVPGEIRGFEYISKKYGRLPWKQVFEPVVKLARNGFPINQDLFSKIDGATLLSTNPAWSPDFAPDGTLLRLGDTIKRTRFAKTLEFIANKGASAFYTGYIANATSAAVRAHNGTMTLDDLTAYKVKIRPVIDITYRGFKVTSCTAPSSGAVVLSALKIIEGFRDIGEPLMVNLSTHRVDEAWKYAYGQRLHMGDPYFVPGMSDFQAKMVKASTAASNRAKILDTMTFNVPAYDPTGLEQPPESGTSHIAVADNDGMVISMTSTINTFFGSQVMVPETGIILNNEMNDFSIPGMPNSFNYAPAPANYIAPGKTPLSSMSPTIVEHLDNGTFYFGTGSAGGSRIVTATFQSLWYVLDWKLTPQQALNKPRMHDQLIPPTILFEYAYDNSTVSFMKNLGHNVSWIAPGLSTAQSVQRLSDGAWQAGSDPNAKEGAGLFF